MNPRLRDVISGAVLLPALVCIGVGGSAFHWTDAGFAGTLGRMFDSLAPHLLALGVVLAGLIAVLGRGAAIRGVACALILAALATALPILSRHNAVSVTTEAETEVPAQLTVLWFNVYADNLTPPDTLATALLAAGADLIVLGEATSVLPVLDRLTTVYPHRLGCDTPDHCSTLVLSRLPFAPDSATMIRTSRPDRMASVRLVPPQGPPIDVVAVHMAKPWFYGFYDVDLWHLLDQSASSTGPLLVLGDFNAAPWSRPGLRILDETGLTPARNAPATWPAGAGRLGVPIDQMLVRGGLAFTALAPWGHGLESNHLGLIANIAWLASTEDQALKVHASR